MLRTKIISLFTIILIVTTMLFGQYDHRQVMLNQIRRLEARREFTQVISIYEDLLKRYPDDEEIVSGFFNTLVNVNRIEEASRVLDQYNNLFTPQILTQHQIILAIRKGEANQARQLGLNYLRDNPGVVNLYRDFASIYERGRQFDTAIEVLQLARRNTRDDHLFALEMARNYENMEQYDNSVQEYIKHLERNSGFLFFVTNRIKDILNEDSNQIRTLERSLSSSDNETMLELYALSLAHIENYEEAFQIYQRLEPEKLNQFADELFSAGRIDLARQAYEQYRNTIQDPIKSADVGIKIALLYISVNQLSEAEQILTEIVTDRRIQDRQLRFRTRANRQARELLADIAIRLEKSQDEIIRHFEDAKTFAFNRNEQKEVDLKIVHYLIMSENYQQADNRLQNILQDEQSGSQITNMSHYYKYMLALMRESTPSDSLLTEMIISMPGSDLTNEALFLTVILNEMYPSVRNIFLEAYRTKSVYRDREALNKLLEIDSNIIDEEIILISGQWALEAGDTELAETLFSHDFRDDTLAGYALIRLAEIKRKEHLEYRDLLTNFLKDNPTHIFSPKFRLLLTSRPPATVRRPD
ncbi:MAG: hypothetical protein K0B81_00560 [Candidatus Cloacimonetes bacterium]|nr:hypothetical protein [Candidatus Cloacimonadota bacterium]